MPTLVPAELDKWMQDLQVDLQNAMNQGDQRRVVEWRSESSAPGSRRSSVTSAA